MNWSKKDLLGMKQLNKEEIMYILDTAATMKNILYQKNKKTPHLQGKTIINLFYENSTRTRLSFELAAKYMSANAANIAASSSSVAKGETLIDTGRTINMMGTDIVIMRHNMTGAPHLLAKNINASVINAGDGMNEHPTQALLDFMTIKQVKGKIEGLKVAIIGDIIHSRVARSNIYGLSKLGAKIYLAGPKTLIPKGFEKLDVRIVSVKEALENADVVMGLRIQKERQKSALFPSIREYSKYYGVNDENIKLAKDDVMIMHPGPVNRGVELTSSIIDADFSMIDEQVANGLAVRMAILYIYSRRDKFETTN